MAEIIIFGGTTEGRKLAEALLGTQMEVHLCVATAYGASLLPQSDNIIIHTGKLEAEDMRCLLQLEKPELVVDATHPYAAVVTKNIREICRKLSCPLLRILRKDTWSKLQENVLHGIWQTAMEDVTFVNSVEEAAAFLADTQGKIMITTGSKELEKYTVIEDYQNRCIARVLPTLPVMEKCAGLGFTGKNLIAMQGPFSEEMNYQMLKQAGCSYLVTKDSGKEGGYEEKCEAAIRAGVKLIIVKRPEEAALTGDVDSRLSGAFQAMPLSEAIDYLFDHFELKTKRTAFLIGAGPGSVECLQESGIGGRKRWPDC